MRTDMLPSIHSILEKTRVGLEVFIPLFLTDNLSKTKLVFRQKTPADLSASGSVYKYSIHFLVK